VAKPDAYWDLVRQQFPLEKDLVYLNAANICPASRLVSDRHTQFAKDFNANPSMQNREKFKLLQEEVRAKLAAVLGASADEIAITRNTSEASNLFIQGIDLQAGDEIVITDHNHQSNREAWQIRAKRHGLVIKTVPIPIPAPSKDALIAAFERAMTPKTKVVAFTHVTSTTGTVFPAREICGLAHRRNAWVHLDGAQSFGMLQLNLREIGCDSFSGSAHKWMMGPLEAGILYIRESQIARIWPAIVTAGWSDTLKGARKFENVGQRDDPRVAAFGAAIDFYNLVGPQKVEERARFLAAHVKQKLAGAQNVRMKTNLQPELSAGIVKVQITNRPTRECFDQLWKNHRLALAITDSGDAEGLRISPHIYNSVDDLNQAVSAILEIAKG
jgi:selenocysteine lyase/cysteine desulfurase